jgi:hypothetical protein
MNFDTICQKVEMLFIILLVLRLVFVFKSVPVKLPEIWWFTAFLLLDLLLFPHLISNENWNFHFVHFCIPTMFSLTLFLNTQTWKLKTILILLLVGSNFYFWNFYLIEFWYIISIAILVFHGLKLSQKANKKSQLTPVYLFFAVDQFISFIIFLMRYLPFNWKSSELLPYFSNTVNFIFPFTILIIHVKFRRLVFN